MSFPQVGRSPDPLLITEFESVIQTFFEHVLDSWLHPKAHCSMINGSLLLFGGLNSKPIISLWVMASPVFFPSARTIRMFSRQNVSLYWFPLVEHSEESEHARVLELQDTYMLLC